MSMLQIKNVPDELKEKLASRAKAEGKTMSALVIDFMWAELSMPSTRDWVARRRLEMESEPEIDTAWAIAEVREEFEAAGRL